jgi:hypothetical protein
MSGAAGTGPKAVTAAVGVDLIWIMTRISLGIGLPSLLLRLLERADTHFSVNL